ncbi:MAG: hypothetical protein GX957_00905, partial [Clostridiaceae bacterium]|nr:hypothetical protein [Clostridiaceae bacterium]
MAKSYDKNKDFINDDIIKQALKTGLKSIQPSEELIAKTIDRCSSEISENRVNNKKNKFNPWIYRFSAPIAAGALVLLIVLNYNNLFVRYKSNESTPQSAAHGSDLTLNSSEILAGVDSARSASPEIALDEPSSSVYGLKEDTELKGFAMAEAPYNASNLKSYSVHEENKRTEGTDNSEAFKYIANNFNSEKKTDYVLDVTNIVRANTFVSEGVYADTLLSTEDYRDLLSNEGYWILPLKDNQ